MCEKLQNRMMLFSGHIGRYDSSSTIFGPALSAIF